VVEAGAATRKVAAVARREVAAVAVVVAISGAHAFG
jgi:hypothetical protein